MPAPDSFTDHLRDQLSPLGVTTRQMFGSTGLFQDGLLIGLVHQAALYLRADDGNRALLGDAPQPFRYARKGRPAELAFWRVPDDVLDDQDELVAWARAALAAARRVAVERARKKPRRGARTA